MKRQIYISDNKLILKVELSAGLKSFPDYIPIFVLSKNEDDSFKLNIYSNLVRQFKLSKEMTPLEGALSIVNELTQKESTEMHKLITMFYKGKTPNQSFAVEYKSDGTALLNSDIDLESDALIPVMG